MNEHESIGLMEPMVPRDEKLGEILDLANLVSREASRLAGGSSEAVRLSLGPLLRSMNSYYTNKIEGQHTLPSDIEKALKKDFGDRPDIAKRRRLAVAHLQTEMYVEQESKSRSLSSLYEPRVVSDIHRHLYSQLQPDDRMIEDGSIVEPGALRVRDVKVGMHVPPGHVGLPAFLRRWSEAYGSVGTGSRMLIAAACAHHRLAWIHPFLDGNGRVARLHSHLVLHAGERGSGLWSVMRGFARSHQEYYDRLHNADLPREGSLDGRGHLSEKRLVEFAIYFLSTCLDQVQFMGRMLDLADFKDRLSAAVAYESSRDSRVRMNAVVPLHYVFLAGELARQDFKVMTGLQPKTAQRMVAALLDRHLLLSDSRSGRLRFNVPLHSLRFYFPQLWPEAEAELKP